ncbi:hypothetical protein FEM48_Zijuj12G0065800 [Ziziphus jujuba var. spinosa]|uniref:Uncharacterized protein n=1 Tax=Ziziphus jujuba var. spinosa TaxID=714518 RepID=A0A978UBR1_ZIZJJ|nr:hypothetical protein FEM48_Zijuj12G0065800 [Ziziphus jujuba var. spinosa]
MKVKVVCRKIYDYIRYDLKEIAFPSSLPDPPHIKKRRKLTFHERYFVCSYCNCSAHRVLKEASRLYAASWVRDIGPELRPNDYKKAEESEDMPSGAKSTKKEKEPSTLEDLEKEGETVMATSVARIINLLVSSRFYEAGSLLLGDRLDRAILPLSPKLELLVLMSYVYFLMKITAVAARGGMETLRPALQRVYMTRASAYKDALKSFIQGYQEGIQQAMEKKDSKSQQESDKPNQST